MPTNSSLTKLSRKSSTEEIIVGEHLADLRGRIRLLTWVSGLCWMSVAFLGGLLVTGTLDWLLHFDDSGTRLVLGLALLGLSGRMLWRQLIAPLRLPLSGSFLAGRVERRFPGLKNRLLSAVEFLEHRLDSQLGSTELQKAVVGQALQDLERIEPGDVVETKAIRNVTIAGVLVFMVAALVVLIRPLEAATSVQRMIFPFANIPWPRAVELKLVRSDLSPVDFVPDQPILMARGDTLELYVENERGRLPERVWFEYQNEEEGPIVRDSLRQTTVRDESGRVHETAVISWIATSGTLRFRASGGDDHVMPFYRVDVVPPPSLKSLQVTVTPPPYSQQEVQVLAEGVGHVQGLLGTKIEVVATADKLLKSARLRVGEQPAVALELQQDNQSFAAAFEIKDAVVSNYWFELTDTEGFTDREAVRFELRGIADTVPEVVIEAPVSDVLLTAEAELPVDVLAKDDLGLRQIRIAYQIGDDEQLKLIPLFSATAEAGESAETGESATEPAEKRNVGPQRHQAAYLWKMADLNPEPGMKIVFRGEATDDYDLGQPHVGKSVPRSITIVSGDEKQKELAMRVSDLLEDLKQATQLQQRALQQTQELQTQLDEVGELRPQDIDQLQRTELDQRQAASRLTHSADGVETQAQQLLDEFQANRLNDEATEKRLERVVGELGNLGREALPEAERALMQAQKLAEQGIRPENQGKSGTPRANDSSKQNKPNKNSAGRKNADSPGLEDGSKKGDGEPDSSDSVSGDQTSAASRDDGAAAPEKQNPADRDTSAPIPSKQNSESADLPKENPVPGETSQDDAKSTSGDDPSATPGVEAQAEGTSSPEPTRKSPSPPQKSLRSALADAQTQQSRSLESLSELQESLTEWRDRRDVSKDLNSVIADQEKLQQDAAELAAETMSKSAAELSQQEKAELNKLADRQRKIAEQLEQFRKQVDKTSESLQKNDPDTAERLSEVGQELQQQETASKLQEAANNIADNRMGAAADSQQQAMNELQEVERMMKRQPNDNTEQFLQQTQEALQEFQEIRAEQQNLAERFEELNQQQESIQKEEQQEELMRQQEELTERMAKAERKLERLSLRGASEAANRARKRLNEMMQQAQEVESEESGEEMQQAMEEALEDLDQVEMELALEKRVAKERLAFEQLEKIEDQLKSLRVRQESVIAETIRLEEAKTSEGRMTRGQVKTLLDLAETERSLQLAAEEMAQNMASAEVFSLVLKRLGRSLKFAAESLGERQTDAKTQAMEQDAIRKIDSLLSVLKQEQKKRDPAESPAEKPEELAQERQEEAEKPEQAQAPGEMLPELAQLKLLKSLQEEYLERTELLNQFRDKDGTLPASMEDEKNELAREQAELADFARNLIAKFLQQKPEPAGGEMPEKEAEDRRKDEDATKIDP